MPRFRVLFLLCFLAPAVLGAAPSPELDGFIRQFRADADDLGAFYDLRYSELSWQRREKFWREWQERLAGVDFPKLDRPGQVDYLLLRNHLESSLADSARDRSQLAGIDFLKFRNQIYQLEEARWRNEPVKLKETATMLGDVGRQLKELKQKLEKDSKEKSPGLPTPVIALRAAPVLDEVRSALERWFEAQNGFQPEFGWWLKTPVEETGKQLEELAKCLREEIAGQKGKDEDPLVGAPIGAEAVADLIRLEVLPYSADELIALGEREMAWCEAELKRAAREMGCGDDWKSAMNKVKSDYVPPGEQDELVDSIAREAIAFTKKYRFATVPSLSEEVWRLSMMEPDKLKHIPYAAYSGQSMMVAYPREEMEAEDKLMVMRGNNRAFTRLTVMHELIPGHHLQLFQMARIARPHRRDFQTTFYIEGWALYCELRFWELGWPRTPQERIGMLFWRMNRASRIVVTLKFHLGKMTPEEMVEFLVDRVGHERFGAMSEVRRYISVSPLNQAAYMLGGKQLLALRNELVPAKMTDQQFNDAVLAAGPIPIELLRAELRSLPLTPDAKPAWRFADEKPAR